MDYIETNINLKGLDIDSEIIVAELAEIGYESFLSEPSTLKAYIQQPDLIEEKLATIVSDYNLSNVLNNTIKKENWNLSWETSYEPIIVDNFCYIRATFHQSLPGFKHELIIDPKMSFGTGHHQTTRLMIQAMQTIVFTNKTVLDMGCGTGILAIFAEKMGASAVTAIDIDSWSIENTTENMVLNNCTNIEPLIGEAKIISRNYDIILANINRNVLLRDMKTYAHHLNNGGYLVLSGFYEQDNRIIIEETFLRNLKMVKLFNDEQWLCLLFTKNSY